MKNLLFIPAYNCQNQIIKVIQSLQQHNVEKYFSEILIINNQSTDNTEQNAIEACKLLTNINIKVLTNNNNYSLGGTQKVAFNYAIEHNFDYVAILHGDNQGDIKDLLLHINHGAYDYDQFLGSRFNWKSRCIGYAKVRIIGNYCVNLYASLMLKHIIKDTGSGLNMYKVKSLDPQYYMSFPNSLNFNIYLLLSAIHKKQKIFFFSLTWKEDGSPSNARVIRQALEILKVFFQYRLIGEKLFQKLINKTSLIVYGFTQRYPNKE